MGSTPGCTPSGYSYGENIYLGSTAIYNGMQAAPLSAAGLHVPVLYTLSQIKHAENARSCSARSATSAAPSSATCPPPAYVGNSIIGGPFFGKFHSSAARGLTGCPCHSSTGMRIFWTYAADVRNEARIPHVRYSPRRAVDRARYQMQLAAWSGVGQTPTAGGDALIRRS